MRLLTIMKKLYSMVGILFVFLLIRWSVTAEPKLAHNDSSVENSSVTNLTEFNNFDDDFVFHDPMERSHIDSEYCATSTQCDAISYHKRCSCDSMCGVLNDCCPTADNATYLNMSFNQFSCKYKAGIGKIMLITKCAADWKVHATKSLCENEPLLDDTLSRVIVSHKTIEGFVYRNMHCALCNNIHDYQFWSAIFQCYGFDRNNNISECALSFAKPKGNYSYRDCKLHSSDIISDCPSNYNFSSIEQKCEQESTLLVSADYSKFKNKYCAICNGYTEKLSCEFYQVMFSENNVVSNGLTYRMLVDFNTKETFEERPFVSDRQLPFKECNGDQMYDPVSSVCRNIMCPDYTHPFDGKCVSNELPRDLPPLVVNAGNTSEVTEHCPLSRLNPNEFEYRNTTHQIIFRNKIYNDTQYVKNGSDVFLCINTSVALSYRRQLQASDKIERYMSFVGLIISVVALTITIIVYFIFSELLNIPGKTLVSLCIALLMSQLIFLLSPLASGTDVPCKVLAVLMHYFFLTAFAWMNVSAFDLLMTFSNMMKVSNRMGTSSKKFYLYSFYSWCIPVVIVCLALVLDFAVVNETVDAFQPRYGQGVCWISSRNALLLFFVGPLALFKLFDVIAFGFIVYFITRAHKQGAMATNKSNSRTFCINLKLSLVMGLTWIFAFIANFTGNTIMWYLFIIFNTLQGLLISISFLCTRRVFRLIKSRYTKTKSKSFTNTLSTHTTSLS